MPSQSWSPDSQRTERAIAEARRIVDSTHAGDLLRTYYTWESNYAGATFLSLRGSDNNRITGDDLMAVTTLAVSIGPMAIRRLTEGDVAQQISELLNELDPELRLEDPAVPSKADTMGRLYELVKRSLRRANRTRSAAWVTASKICARKRPHLFPVRDSVVVGVLGLTGDYNADWPVFAGVIGDEMVRTKLAEIVRKADADAAVDVGDQAHLLRHLDVLLWMEGKRRQREGH